MTEKKNGGIDAAKAHARSFVELAARLDSDDWRVSEKAGHEAGEEALEVLGNVGWQLLNWKERGEELDFSEYTILFATGGPAVRAYKEAGGDWRMQGQDWFTPWEDVELTSEERKATERVCDYILELHS